MIEPSMTLHCTDSCEPMTSFVGIPSDISSLFCVSLLIILDMIVNLPTAPCSNSKLVSVRGTCALLCFLCVL